MNTTYQTNRFLFFTLLFSALAFAQEEESSISFTRHVIFKPADGGNSAVVADINEDEKQDVVSSSSMDDTIRWYKNLGEGVFTDEQGNYTDHTIFDNADHAWSVAVGDIDGDTDIDVVAVAGSGSSILWYESNAASLNVEKVLPQTTVLYPNPTSSEVYLNYATATNTTYGLFDMAGKRLAKFTQSGTAHQLDVSSVSKGTYILKATSGLQVNYYRIVKE